jgi:hypothetical protein
MRLTRTSLLSGPFVWLAAGAALWLSASAGGQTAPSGETPAAQPAVTVERQGRLLVLNYEVPGQDVQSEPNSPPGFAIYQGQKKIASGQFEYG